MLSPTDLFDLSEFEHAHIFDDQEFAWGALGKINTYIKEWAEKSTRLPLQEARAGVTIEGSVYIGQGTKIEVDTYIKGPTIIGDNCEIRQGSYIRGDVIVGNNCVVGHNSELKNSILLDYAHAPHFAYVGDSILGNHVNLGAGVKLANLPILSTKDPVTGKRPTIFFTLDGQRIDTGLSKLGAILGDHSQIGCNAVTSPGCIVGPRTLVYALVSLRKGYYPADTIIKLRQVVEQVSRIS
jgi:UDP-N-acetylglucosamine diphosphorylase / glucose-1-phosphate thymidylyltransferase / UDP-N-acetylgalactosamine diphosphorylase / glucosamine-1-phosphate N-acetyltransferase / galactosamine-1-phosphate N-acetyltransferase